MDETETTDWLTPAEAARRVGVTVRTLHRWEEAGRLTPLRTLGGHRRYNPAELDTLQRPA